jgi:S-disulfanyl-L-cysteine oxidoreductase SoxD
MSTFRGSSLAVIAAVLGLSCGVALPAEKNGLEPSAGLGQPISEADIKAWDITVLPDGTNLPPGSGTAAQGAKLFVEKGCVACHGEGGKGGSNGPLISDLTLEGRGIEAYKTIKNFWANATTLFDYIRRAMPWPMPRTLSDEEVYSLTAYILAGNKLIGENDTMNAQTLPKVRMPNRDNFIVKFPDKMGAN